MHSLARNLCAIAAVAIMASANGVGAKDFQAPGQQPFKVTGAQLAIKSPASNACPNQAKMTGWIMTTKPVPSAT